ncbi:MAG: thioredoxin [Planctomycetes bacterium]|nr:thioredoxin [Planctomycetota bacterium]
MTERPHVVDITELNFERDVIDRSMVTPVVVDFWAPWCGPCKLLGPMLEALAKEKAGAFVLAKVDVDQAPGVAAAFGVQSVPMVVAMVDGQPVSSFVGAQPKPELERFINALIPSETDQAAEETAAVERDDPTAAEARYRELLEGDPKHEGALVGLARLLIGRGDFAAAEPLLQTVGEGKDEADEVARLNALVALHTRAQSLAPRGELEAQVAADPKDKDALFALGCSLAGGGDYEAALEHLIKAARRNKAFAKETVAPAMVEVFNAVGQRSALADRYRDLLAMVLF